MNKMFIWPKYWLFYLLLSNNSNSMLIKIFLMMQKIYFEKKDYVKSKFLFQKFLVFNPKDYLSYLYLAKIYKEEDNNK